MILLQDLLTSRILKTEHQLQLDIRVLITVLENAQVNIVGCKLSFTVDIHLEVKVVSGRFLEGAGIEYTLTVVHIGIFVFTWPKDLDAQERLVIVT